MERGNKILVIGSDELALDARRYLPASEVGHAQPLLEGVWQSGHEKYSGVLLGLDGDGRAMSALRALRSTAPDARIIVACRALHEPLARASLDVGADDYVITPLHPEELVNAFATGVSVVDGLAPHGATPSASEIGALASALHGLSDGAAATLSRLGELVQSGLGAAGVRVEIDGQQYSTCSAEEVVIEHHIERDHHVVGRLALARRTSGSYPGAATQRLAEYAALIGAVMDQQARLRDWRELAWSDDLSGLRNRRFFDATLDEMLAHASAERQRVTVLLFDIDDFKSYNDRFGYSTGDNLIREISSLLRHCTRSADVVARYGGDEFAVIIWDSEKRRQPESEHPHEPALLADRFCRTIAAHAFACLGEQAPGPVTISGGIANFPWHGTTRAALLERAAEALRDAKGKGKNTIQLSGTAPVTKPIEAVLPAPARAPSSERSKVV